MQEKVTRDHQGHTQGSKVRQQKCSRKTPLTQAQDIILALEAVGSHAGTVRKL